MEKQYDFRELILAYIKATRSDYPHQDFKDYYKGLLAALEKAFGVSFASPRDRALFMLFHSTVNSYLAIRTPWSGFLEDGLINVRLQQAGVVGDTVYDLSEEISRLTEENEQVHLKMLETLFKYIYGEVTVFVTSKDLEALGFDDSKEPNISDYWDYV